MGPFEPLQDSLNDSTVQGFDPARVEFRQVPLALAGIEEAVDALTERLVRHGPFPGVVRFDTVTATVEIEVQADYDSGPLRDSLEGLPVDVEYRFSEGAPELLACSPPVSGYLEAGRLFEMRTSSSECAAPTGLCTSGFAATISGNQGVFTAGHCPGSHSSHYASIMYADGTNELTSTRFHSQAWNVCCDAQFERELYSSSILRAKVYLSGQNWQSVTGFVNEHPNQTWLCMKGRNTAAIHSHAVAQACGRIVDNVSAPEGSVIHSAVSFAEVELEVNHIHGGDSGGPVYSSGTARGLINSGIPVEPHDGVVHMWYNKIGYVLSELGASLATE